MNTTTVSGGFASPAHKNFQVIDGGRDKDKPSIETRRSIYRRIRLHGHGLQAVAKEHGMTRTECLDTLMDAIDEHYNERIKAAWRIGYRDAERRLCGINSNTAMRAAA